MFNRDFNGINPNYGPEGCVLDNEIISMTYLASDLHIVGPQAVVLRVFINLRLKIKGQYGTRGGNKLAIFTVNAKASGTEEEVQFCEEDRLDSVCDAIVCKNYVFMHSSIKNQVIIFDFNNLKFFSFGPEKLVDVCDYENNQIFLLTDIEAKFMSFEEVDKLFIEEKVLDKTDLLNSAIFEEPP
jgi:hypothetical protein